MVGTERHFPRAMALCKNEVLHFYREEMERIKITSNTVFLLETENQLPDRQQELLLQEWNAVFPNNKLIIAKKGSLRIIESVDDQN